MSRDTLSEPDYISACPDCDLLVTSPRTTSGYYAKCPRCNKTLGKSITNSIDKVLALSLTGLFLYLPAMLLPLLSFHALGMSMSGNVMQTIFTFFQSGKFIVAVMMLISAAVFPLLLLSMICFTAYHLKKNVGSPYLPRIFRHYLHLQEWGMVEVYLLGILITIIKMIDTAEIQFHSGFYCFCLLVLSSLGVTSILDKNLFWKKIEQLTSKHIQPLPLVEKTAVTAKEAGLAQCHTCLKLVSDKTEKCPRCNEKIHSRLSASVSRTWALIITSSLFFFPANLLPIMVVTFLGVKDYSTILDGIIYFFDDGSYGIGIIILTASILVPLFKVIGLAINLLTIHRKSIKSLRQKTQMYRFIEFIGRWSMLDVFVIALLTVLVDFGFFTSIHAAPAASYFCIVVVSTMFATIAFDPRIMWDSITSQSGSDK